jgi:ornithine--oxo-acid transaminase
MGKALGGGVMPVSAIAANAAVMDVFEPGSHGSTFGGNPLSCAVAIAALDVTESEQLADRSYKLGQYFMEKLVTLKHADIAEIRGRGLFIAIELTVPARLYCERLMQLGLLCKETHEYVIRLAPPLIITEAEIDWAFSRIQAVFSNSSQAGG